jgi:hypothetical protein
LNPPGKFITATNKTPAFLLREKKKKERKNHSSSLDCFDSSCVPLTQGTGELIKPRLSGSRSPIPESAINIQRQWHSISVIFFGTSTGQAERNEALTF